MAKRKLDNADDSENPEKKSRVDEEQDEKSLKVIDFTQPRECHFPDLIIKCFYFVKTGQRKLEL